MVGDTLESDIRGARDSGIASIWLNRSGKPKAAGIDPDFSVSSLTEVLGIIA
jgi:FMN phosphatase YigB (HAD superfamily)